MIRKPCEVGKRVRLGMEVDGTRQGLEVALQAGTSLTLPGKHTISFWLFLLS